MEIDQGIAFIQGSYLRTGSPTEWADLGCGDGFFTGILSGLLKEGSSIYAVDGNQSALRQVRVARSIHLQTVAVDFVKEQWWPGHLLDGILMANSLHYAADQIDFVRRLRTRLKPDGGLLIVEYDTDRSNRWVPYPLSWDGLQRLFGQVGGKAGDAGFGRPRKIHEAPSLYNSAGMYSAWVPASAV
jgi:SAM-dependent methyltransferase